ncbi:MAG: prenyltransferase [Candidatus Methanoperedens sp.]|nr:prenyltransferase [Candidatus Methanoperedens sp.]
MCIDTPTIKLLRVSVLVAFSGVCKLHIAFLFLGIEPRITIYLAAFLVIYATYTLDRATGGKEDKINKKEFISARKNIALVFCLVTLAAGSWLFLQENLLIISFLPFIIGYVYSKGINIGRISLKLKGNFGMKNLTVALTWSSIISAIILRWVSIPIVLLFVFPFFAIKSFINTVIYDFRDIKGDSAAGIKTLPIFLGERRTRSLLQSMHITLHLWIATAMFLGFVRPQVTVLMTLGLTGLIYTRYYTRASRENESKCRRIMRDVIVDGEFIMAVILDVIIDAIIDAIISF